MTTAEDVIAQAERWVGFVEGPRNNETPFGKWYGLDLQPYCAMAVSYWSAVAGLFIPASTRKGYAYTPSGANWFKAKGRWGTQPKKGAHVFFNFNGTRIHHMGLVTSDSGIFPIDTIEANTSRGSAGSQRDGGGVWRRRRAVGIVGYGYPDYDQEDDDVTVDELNKALEPIVARLGKIESAVFDGSDVTVVERSRQNLRLERGAAAAEVIRRAEFFGVDLETSEETLFQRADRIAGEIENGRSWDSINRSLEHIALQQNK